MKVLPSFIYCCVHMYVCVCVFTVLTVWINPLVAVSLKNRLPEGYCKCMCQLCPFLGCHQDGGCNDGLGPAIADCKLDFYLFFFYFFFYSNIRALLGVLTCSKTLERFAHTLESVWRPDATEAGTRAWHRGSTAPPRTQFENLMYSSHMLARIHIKLGTH